MKLISPIRRRNDTLLHRDQQESLYCPGMQKIIIIGATSGIGRELARIYAGEGHLVGVSGRRQDLLYSLQLEFPNHVVTECFDVTTPQSITHVQSLIQKLGGLDLLIYNAGYGDVSDALD